MSEKRTLLDRIGNRIFAIPSVVQFWARHAARRSGPQLDNIPFVRLNKPLRSCRVALITTGGIHLPDQPPFDMADPDGDASFRTIGGDVDPATLVITHKYYDHRDADHDLNIVFPLQHVRDLVSRGVLGSLAPRHFGLMGHIDGRHMPRLLNATAPEIAALLAADQVDVALLTPA